MCLFSPQARWGSWGRGAERNGGGVVLDESFMVEKVNWEISFGNAKLTCLFQCPRRVVQRQPHMSLAFQQEVPDGDLNLRVSCAEETCKAMGLEGGNPL